MDFSIVWNTLENDIPDLKITLSKIMSEDSKHDI
ncbi:MAG: hypothetical protein IJQ74_04005 [Synergistaceae bacterium]|nr:hypothetical protein [Synergistaceae bacterium]